jgi:hypothetical protein
MARKYNWNIFEKDLGNMLVDNAKVFGRQVGNVLDSTDATNAIDEASSTQAEAMDRGIAENQRQFDLSRADMLPWLESGRSGLSRLNERSQAGYYDMQDEDLEGPAFNYNFQADPGYQFRTGQAEEAIKRASSARGNRYTPGMFAELSDRISGMASDEYDRGFNRNYGMYNDQYNRRINNYSRRAGNLSDRYNRDSAQAGMGQQQASALANLGSNYASNQANMYGQRGSAIAGGIMGQANARQNSLGNQLLGTGLGLGLGKLFGAY